MTAFSPGFLQYAERAWQARRARLGAAAGPWEKAIREMGEGGPLLRYVAATLPLSDLAEYPPALFAGMVGHALLVWEEFPWCRALPEPLFLKDVLYPRINTEELADCRVLFYKELAPRVRGLALEEAILEVNRWCAAQVTYRSTDDRTSSPLAVYRRGWGRCGEESTFAVTALRSVGIAARQVYAPWWSHCDDNHAWVEAWDGAAWRYLGACEPEPELDRGWFTSAAARAMFIHTRAFVGDWPATLPAKGEGEGSRGQCPLAGSQGAGPLGGGLGGSAPKPPEASERSEPNQKNNTAATHHLPHPPQPAKGERARGYAGQSPAPPEGPAFLFPHTGPLDLDVREGVAYEDITARYAPARPVAVTLLGEDGLPAAGAGLTFSVLNMAAYREIARRVTDSAGQARLNLGLGSVHVLAEKDGCCAEALWDTNSTDALSLQLAPAGQAAGRAAFTFRAPASPGTFPPPLAPAQKASRKAMLEEAAALREGRRGASTQNETEKLVTQVGAALEGPPCQGVDAGKLTKRVLALLTEKDRSEPIAPRVVAHCAPALAQEGEFPQEVFEKYLLCPRIGLEPLRAWRGVVSFAPGLRDAYREDPRRLWQWVQRHCPPISGYGALPQSPLSALQGAGEQGRKALFCGLCRQNGIPARLAGLDGEPEYWHDGAFRRLGEGLTARLRLTAPADRAALWGQGYSLSRWGGGSWQLLRTPDIPAGESAETALAPGLYRLLTVLRLPSGDQLAQQEEFCLAGGERREAALVFPQAESSQLLQEMALPPFVLFDPAGQVRPGPQVLSGEELHLLCWLEPNREPTEHLLLELREAAAGFAAAQGKCGVHLITETMAEDPALSRALGALPFARRWLGDFSDVEGLARQLFVDPERLPLVLLADRQGHGLYACSGYNVGVAALLLRLMACC